MKIQAKNAKWYLNQCKVLAALAKYADAPNASPSNADIFDAEKLLAKLRRIEARANREYTQYCNVGYTDEERDALDEKITKAVLKLLPYLPPEHFHLNGDPRGYALKVESEYAKQFPGIYRDFGGYGIIAPEF